MLQFWHSSKNADSNPDRLAVHYGKTVWFEHVSPSTNELHEWQARMGDVLKGHKLSDRAPRPICYEKAKKDRLMSANASA